MKLRLVLAALVALAASSCISNGTADDFPCICGTPEAAIDACLHPLCADNETNPDNPDCACGTLSFEE